MSRYNHFSTYVFAPNPRDLWKLLQKDGFFEDYWDYVSIEKRDECLHIGVTQLGGLQSLTRYAVDHPDFIFLEYRSGETGYKLIKR